VVHSNTAVYIITQSLFNYVMTIATHYIITDETFNFCKVYNNWRKLCISVPIHLNVSFSVLTCSSELQYV